MRSRLLTCLNISTNMAIIIKNCLVIHAKAANIGNYVYGVTTGREWFCQSSVIMRKDILDECGIDVSSITDYKDLTDVYATVKEKYPDMVMMASNNSATPDTKYEMNIHLLMDLVY